MYNTRFLFGAFLILVVVTIAIFAPHLAPFDPLKSGVQMLEPSSRSHWLGTDELGRDVLSRVIYGARSSLLVGAGAAAIALAIGVFIGLVAGYFRGWVDTLINPVIDLFISLPALVLALLITVVVGVSFSSLILTLGFVMWPPIARLIRAQVLSVRERTYIEAALALGGSSAWIIRRHILPNIITLVASQFAITVAFAIFTSASLSFLGLGVPPPTPDWGTIVRAGYEFLTINPWMSLGPGGAVTLTVIGFYLLGSSFR